MSAIDAIRARRAAITPGPRVVYPSLDPERNTVYLKVGDGDIVTFQTKHARADAEFDAAAPADIDTLLARIAELEAALQDAIDALGWAPPIDLGPIRLVNAAGDTMAELTPHGVHWVANPLPAELTITPEDRAVWLGLQLENARLQHEVERLQDELTRAQELIDIYRRAARAHGFSVTG